MLLQIENLNAYFKSNKQNNLYNSIDTFQLSNISINIKHGQCFGIAGESGSGKSMLMRIIMGLDKNVIINSGNIIFDNNNLLIQNNKTKEKIYNQAIIHKFLGKDISYIPQDPLSSLNPLHKVYKQIEEVLIIHKLILDSMKRKEHIIKICNNLGLDENILYHYPHELSGGQRQRISIAIALIGNPKLIICDEPTTALDSFLSFQIVELLKDISKNNGIAILFVTHDLGILRYLCDENIIMQNGKIIEILRKNNTPKHLYTRQLFDAHFLDKRECNNIIKPIVMKLSNFSVGVKKSNFFSKKLYIITKKVNLVLQEGKTLGIIGESGSGKSSLAQGVLHLMDTNGEDFYFNKKLSCNGKIDKTYLKYMRKKMQIVFQDSTTSLNPRFRVRDLVSEGLLLQKKSKDEIQKDIENVFNFLELERDLLDRYPSELSGGQRQRVAIARCMVLYPSILILDEPTSALDKFVQKNTLQLLSNMQKTFNLSYMFITHDINIVSNMCDDVAVMFEGNIVEYGAMEEVLHNPKHEYTKKMMEVYHHFYSN